MLLFTNMVAQTTVLQLYRIIEPMSWETDEHRLISLECEKRAVLAAQEIVILAKSLSQLSYFKASPLAVSSFFSFTHRIGPSIYADTPFLVC